MIPGIGNMVLVNGVPTEIYSIVSDGSGGYGYNSFEGGMPLFYEFTSIPLTSEILEKCGFVDRKLDNFYFFENGNLVIEGYEHDYNGLFIGNSIKFLHELQNLYRWVKGEELTVNL